MTNLLAVFICPNCGEVLEDQVVQEEIIDTNRDDVWIELLCTKCSAGVKRKHPIIDGVENTNITCWQEVSEERWLAFVGFYDPADDEDVRDMEDDWIDPDDEDMEDDGYFQFQGEP